MRVASRVAERVTYTHAICELPNELLIHMLYASCLTSYLYTCYMRVASRVAERVTYTHAICELPHELLNKLRLLGIGLAFFTVVFSH